MILYKNKKFISNSEYSDTDWVGDADYILNDNNEKDAELEAKIISLYPNFDFVLDDNGNISDVIETESVPKLPIPPTNAELAAAIAELAEVICSG